MRRLFVLSLAITTSCELVVGSDDPQEDPTPVSQNVEITRKLDVLFVVDNSGSMAEEQLDLASRYPELEQTLAALPGGMPDLHVGVVSTNMGAIAGIPGCEVDGDRGVLQNAPRVSACSPPSDRFMAQNYDSTGAVQTNFSATAGETFSCIANLGTIGCGFESPLAAAKAALDGSNPENDRFLRDDAALLVVILSDEDDCSVADNEFYSAQNGDPSSPLGPFSSFRCFEFGVQCSPDNPRTLGDKSGCEAREGSLLTNVSDYVEFFEQLKPDGRIAVASVHGVPALSAGAGYSATTIANPTSGQLAGTPALAPVCSSAGGEAAPAIRLAEFATSFANSETPSICEPQIDVRAIARRTERPLDTACLIGPAAELSCTATLTELDGQTRALPQCTQAGTTGCFELNASDAACGGGGALRVRHAPGGAVGSVVTASCLAP